MRIFKYDQFRSDIHPEDVLDIIEKTAAASPHDIRFNRDYWRAWLHEIVKQPDLYTVILGVEENKIVGILVGQLYFSHPLVQFSKIATELFWYVDPDHRGKNSFGLMDEYEAWAKDVGATHITMSLLNNEYKDKLDRIYKLKGYVPLETQYMKVIDNA